MITEIPSRITHQTHPEAFGFRGAEKYRHKLKFMQKYGNACFYCGCNLTPNQATKDHLFPKSQGHELVGNMVLACPECNHKKGDMIPCRDIVVRFVKWWSLFPYKTSAVGELYHEFHQQQFLISLLEWLCGEPNIPGEVRASWEA